MRIILAAFLAAVLCWGEAQAQSPNNVSRSWSAPSMPSTDFDRTLRAGVALQDHLLNNGGAGTNAGGGTVNHYNAPVTNNYTGPMSNSGSTVTNVQNLSDVTASGGSTVTTTQGAFGGTQSGAANANATVQRDNGISAPITGQAPTSN